MSFILLSAAQGTPLGNLVACSSCFVPLEMSITEPLMTTPCPKVAARFGGGTVVAFGPLPTVSSL